MADKKLEHIELTYPVLALRCHELVEAAAAWLQEGGVKIAKHSAGALREQDSAYVRTMAEYYAKLHTVTGMPLIFLRVTSAVWAATSDIPRGLWAIELVEAALECALDVVAVDAVEAGITYGDEPDPSMFQASVNDGVQLVAAAVFDTALALIER